MAETKARVGFIDPMLLLRTEKLPEGPDWLYELKFDGYRALEIKSGGKVQLRSRNDNDFSARYAGIVKALAPMPDETVIDGRGGGARWRRQALPSTSFKTMAPGALHSTFLSSTCLY